MLVVLVQILEVEVGVCTDSVSDIYVWDVCNEHDQISVT